ncbi:MAG TPA: 50S ribosomal protein L9 [Thermoanaerobaculia bacterium]|nr:50S ribosomal protein L9 [Thermoanaerobaculia bacterium]
MKVILLSDLRHTGKRGQVVSVKPGFARNYLLPKKLAAPATPGNLKWFEEQRSKIDARHASERTAAAEIAARLASIKLEIKKRAGESETLYGSVTPAEVEQALAAKGVEVDRRSIDLAGGIKTLGEHTVRIDLHSEVVAELELTVVAET